jgi:hypothetical protein
MKALAIVIAVLALGAGIVSAYQWYLSATLQTPKMDLIANYQRPDGPEGSQPTPIDAWLVEVSQKNRWAAGWAAGSVVLGALSSIIGTLS